MFFFLMPHLIQISYGMYHDPLAVFSIEFGFYEVAMHYLLGHDVQCIWQQVQKGVKCPRVYIV